MTPLQLYFTYRSAFEYGQFWRVFTTFLYWGNLSLDFFFHLFFLCVPSGLLTRGEAGADARRGSCSMRYSRMLEESTFHGRRGDYVWLLIVSCTLLLVSATVGMDSSPTS